MGLMPALKLTILKGVNPGAIFMLEEGSNLIGRWDPDGGAFPEVDLESEDTDALISRKHAIIERRGEKATIEDVGSLNGTFLNRTTKLQKGMVYQLNSGDEILIGKTLFRFEVEI